MRLNSRTTSAVKPSPQHRRHRSGVRRRRSTTYCYDHRGNAIKKTQVTASSTYGVGYEYSLADRLSAINYPDGARVEYTRDALGRISAVKVRPTATGTLTSVISALTWQPFGPALTYTFATGSQSLSLSYDQNYWLTDVGGSVLSLHFCRDAVANITRLKTSTPACTGTPTEQYAYDALYRLSQVQNGSGGSWKAIPTTSPATGSARPRAARPRPTATAAR